MISNKYWYVKMPDVTACFGKSIKFITFFCEFCTIIKCQMWLQVIERSLILLRFFLVFSYVIDDHSYLKYCIFTKFSQIACLINTHIMICSHARCNYKLQKVLRFNCVLWKFQCLILHLTFINFVTLKIFYKLKDCFNKIYLFLAHLVICPIGATHSP